MRRTWALLALLVGVGGAGCVLDDIDEDGFGALLDCDDWDPLVAPSAEESCDGIDNNCDGRIDEGVTITVFTDADGDGYGDPAAGVAACAAGEGQADVGGDCDDTDAAVRPGAVERCNGIDDDCDPGTLESHEAFWITDRGTRELTTEVQGSNSQRKLVVLQEPGTLQFCQGQYYVDLRIEADVTIERMDERPVYFRGGRSVPVVHVVNGASVILDDIEIVGGAGGIERDGEPYGAGIACEGGSVSARSTVIRGQDTRHGSAVAAWDGCDVTLREVDILDVAESNLHLEGGTHLIEASFIGSSDTSDNWGEGAVFIDADVTLRGTAIERLLSHKGTIFSAVDSSVLVEPSGSTPSRAHLNNAGAGLVLLERSTLRATEWDLGTFRDRTDNDGAELLVVDTGLSYRGGPSATFSCDPTGCGEPASLRLGGAAPDAVSSGTYTRANIVLVSDWAALEEIQVQADIPPECTAEAYIRAYPLPFDGVRRIADKARYPLSAAADAGWLTTGPIRTGLPERDHTAIGLDVRCAEGSTWTWRRGPAPADLGFASWVGTGASASHDGLLFDELEGPEAQAWSMRLQVTSF